MDNRNRNPGLFQQLRLPAGVGSQASPTTLLQALEQPQQPLANSAPASPQPALPLAAPATGAPLLRAALQIPSPASSQTTEKAESPALGSEAIPTASRLNASQ